MVRGGQDIRRSLRVPSNEQFVAPMMECGRFLEDCAVRPSACSAWVLLEFFGEEPERGNMLWADDAEVLAVQRRDLREFQALGDRDHGRINDA